LPGICDRSGQMPVQENSNKLCAFEMRILKTIQKHHMLNPGENVLVAVSGGVDSVALLLCLHKLAPKLHLSLAVAHLNHRIRGQEGDADEDFVRVLSSRLQLPFYMEAIEVKKQAIEGKRNIEELARQKRYEFLRRTARRVGAQKIAVGHNLNDQAETVLFRFIRGSGIEGLSGIHPVVDELVIRPLLEHSRKAIVEYVKQKGADFRDDSTNQDMQRTRNRIRMKLVPYLEKNVNPRLIETLAREASISREAWSYIEAEAKRVFEKLCCREDHGISLKLDSFEAMHPAMQKHVLRQALKECLGSLRGITFRHIDCLVSLCRARHSGDQIRISRMCNAIRQFDTLLLTRQPLQQKPLYMYRLEIPGECRISQSGVIFRAAICSTPDLDSIRGKSSIQAYLDPQSLPQFLVIRSKEPGDRYGGPGHRKVKKLLIDGKVPLLQRPDLPMVVAGKDVIWIPGFRPARAYAVRSESPHCILVEMIRDDRSPEP
jgi:tRNA(Ile)-lysidine synthase